MNITGKHTKSFFRQSGDFSFEVDFQNTSNEFSFYVSGNNNFKFTSKNKALFDNTNKFIYSHADSFNFKAIYSKSNKNISYYIDDNIIGAIKNTGLFFGTGEYFDKFVIDNKNVPMDISLSMELQKPNIIFSPISTSDQILYSGSIIIDNKYANIYSISGYNNLLNGSGISSTGVSNYSYNYVVSGDYFGNDDSIPVQIKTNFGDFIEYVSTEVNDDVDTGYLNFYGDNRVLTTGAGDYLSFNVSYFWTKEKPLTVALYHTQSDSEVMVTGSGIGTGTFTGYLVGSGTLYSENMVGYLISPVVIATGSSSGYFFTTGELVYEPFVTVSGLEGGVSSTGVIQFSLTGILSPGNSGRYLFNQTLTGTPALSYNHLGIVSSPTGIYSGQVNTGIILSKYMSVESTGFMASASGYDSDYLLDRANFNLITGNQDFSVSKDFSLEGYIDASGYYHSGNINGYYDFYGRIYYTPLNPKSADQGVLRISNGIESLEYDFFAT
jgi:hypothetical protein